MRRRVVITGIGAITPIGITRDGLWSGVRSERSAVRSLTRFDPSIFRSHNAAEVNDFVPTDVKVLQLTESRVVLEGVTADDEVALADPERATAPDGQSAPKAPATPGGA